MKTTIKFYKNNKISEEYKIELNKLIGEFMKSNYNNYDLPFERNFLAYISETYPNDSFAPINAKLWDKIFQLYRDYKDLYNSLGTINKLIRG